jgi:hypothetical protein
LIALGLNLVLHGERPELIEGGQEGDKSQSSSYMKNKVSRGARGQRRSGKAAKEPLYQMSKKIIMKSKPQVFCLPKQNCSDG